MPVFAYNIETSQKKFAVSEPVQKVFTEKLSQGKTSRSEWAKMMLFVQKESILNRQRLYHDPVLIKISSIEALQCKNEHEFNRMVTELIKYGSQLYSIAEEAIFNKEYPKGLSVNPQKLEEAKVKLQSHDNKMQQAIENNRKQKSNISSVIEI